MSSSKAGKAKKSAKTRKAPKAAKPKVTKRAPPRKDEKKHQRQQKRKEARAKRKEERPVERPKVERPARPGGEVPAPTVMARHEGSLRERPARGYSRSELSTAGLAGGFAKRWRVPVDLRRRSTVAANVEALKSWLEGSKEGGSASGRKARTGKKE